MSGHASQHTASVIVGLNLAAARKRKGLTQRQVAAHLDVSERMVTRWEGGHNRPSPLYEKELVAFLLDGDLGALYAQPVEEAA